MFIGTPTLQSSLTSRVYWDTNPPFVTYFPCLLGHQPSSRHLLLVFFRTPYPPLVTFFPCLLGHPPSTRHVLPVFIGTPTLHSSLPSRVYWDTNPPVFFFFHCLLGHQPSSPPFLPVFIGTLTLQSSLTSRVYWDTNPPFFTYFPCLLGHQPSKSSNLISARTHYCRIYSFYTLPSAKLSD